MEISRELIFKISWFRKLPFNVVFYPGSESATKYNEELILNAIFFYSEVEKLIENIYSANPIFTQGLIKAEESISDKLTSEQLRQLRTIGFNTADIFEITYR